MSETYEVPAEDVEALLEISDEEFADVLNDALSNAVGALADEPDWQALFHPDVVERTRNALGEHRKQVEGILAGNRDRTNASAATSALRRRINGIQARQQQARVAFESMRRGRHASNESRNAAEARTVARRLTLAIQRHRLAAFTANLAPEPHDRDLWSMLDRIQIGIGGRMESLTELLGSGAWTDEGETPP